METFSVIGLVNRIPDEASAYKFLEELRWGKDAANQSCPHCEAPGPHYYLNPLNGTSRKTRTGANSQRRVWKCRACRKQFSAITGTVMHGTKIPVRTWVLVIFEMCSSKNGVAAREIERKYGLSPKTAWFLLHRIREAMKREPLVGMLSGTVVADETFIGGLEKNKHAKKRPTHITPVPDGTPIVPGERQKAPRGPVGKTAVFTLIDTQTGEARSRVVPDVTGATLRKAMSEQVDMANTVLHTDEGGGYKAIAHELAGHESVNHSKGEYVRYPKGQPVVTSNHAEGYFSQLKRSLDGTHHHVSVPHLPRYLAEFDFRYSHRKLSDTARMRLLMGQVGGRRLTYRPLTAG